MKLYTYDHCPYCVRTRMIFGIKNIPFEHIVLGNADEETPISMIGAKMVPILEKFKGDYMAESLDIVSFIDNIDGSPVIKPGSNDQISQWINTYSGLIYRLCMPRWVKSDLEEFKTEEDRAYFTKKKEMYIGSFDQNLSQSAEYIKDIKLALDELNSILEQREEGGLNYDDIILFGHIRGLTIVEELEFPKNVKQFLRSISELSKVPLY